MKLKQLLKDINIETEPIPEIDICGIADNSKKVHSGDVFVAINGANSNGHLYIEEAIEKGASLIIGENDLSPLAVPYIKVENSRKALGILARNFYKDPSRTKNVIGITGTNGKTTTSFLINHILESSSTSCALIGTIETTINGKTSKSSNTTPSSLSLHRLLSESEDDVAIIEVSSHGLAQYRVEGVSFDLCLFTNLSREHLDYHPSMDAYFETKLRLFDYLKANGTSIVNTDNEWGKQLSTILKNRGENVVSIGQTHENSIQMHRFESDCSKIIVEKDNQLFELFSPIPGVHNMYNTVMAYVTVESFGIRKESFNTYVPLFKGVKGRFEMSRMQKGTAIVVDYAHTADAISHALMTAKEAGAKKITHIFGFRGDRDKQKRKDMMQVTAEISDRYILTMDDLNGVSADQMIEELQNLNNDYGNDKGFLIPDRTLAIQWTMKNSTSGEWILITGKGHESYQQSFLLPADSDQETINYVLKKQEIFNDATERQQNKQYL